MRYAARSLTFLCALLLFTQLSGCVGFAETTGIAILSLIHI